MNTFEQTNSTWAPLRLLNLYRLTLSAVAMLVCVANIAPSPLASESFSLFFNVSAIYLLFSLLNIITIRKQWPRFDFQVYSHVFADITAIILLLHASGGVTSGLGILLIIAVAGGSLLIAGRAAILFATIATLALLSEQVYRSWSGSLWDSNYTQAGLLGASFFATAILAQLLVKRLRESEALAAKRGVDLANMAQLTEYIIQQMQTGILVLDAHNRTRLINASARNLLGITMQSNEAADDDVVAYNLPPALTTQIEHWWTHPDGTPQPFKSTELSPKVMPRFASLGEKREAGTLIFLEDMAAIAQQAQQLKLASLGRLTASIAHEIRNPLGAISHASQLLAEAPQLGKSEIRLTEIIQQHTQRVNTIIENIMQLSRRDRSSPEAINLRSWLASFIDDFCLCEEIAPAQIHLKLANEIDIVRFDASQLQQVLLNLCQNGFRHAAQAGTPQIWLRGELSKESSSPYLEVIDNGKGIEPSLIEHIFEPFFTTATNGTGLGLYISRELCESNQAHLNYIPIPDGGSCFRITFADPRRKQVI